MDQTRIARINALARKAKSEGLTAEELLEQKELRKEYIAAVRKNLQGQLDSIVVQEADGSKHPLQKKKN